MVQSDPSDSDGNKWWFEKSGDIVRLKSVRSDKYLHVQLDKQADGYPVVQSDPSDSDGNKWRVEASGGLVLLKSVRSGKYLHVAVEHD